MKIIDDTALSFKELNEMCELFISLQPKYNEQWETLSVETERKILKLFDFFNGMAISNQLNEKNTRIFLKRNERIYENE